MTTTYSLRGRIYKTLKWGMIQEPNLSLPEILHMLRDVGFDGVELDSPGDMEMAPVRQAAEAAGVCVDGMVDSRHWQVRLSDPRADQRAQGLADLQTAIRDAHQAGGHSVLLVPGHGDDGTRDDVQQRSEEQIRRALPLAAQLGVAIAIENVWNNMFYDPQGANDQSADELAAFVDRFDSPWVGVQFDIGNHQKFASPAGWIRTLGKRIVKLDVKDWSRDAGFCKIGDGDVDWPAVRQALLDINFHGWAAAEVAGGDRTRLQEISQRMDNVLGL